MNSLDNNPMPRPDLSVVVAAWPDDRGLADCLAALAPQLGDGTEVLVVAAGDPAERPAGWPPQARRLAGNGLIPDLWAAGIGEARGGVVAITTAHFRPAPDWVGAVRAAHARLESPAIGGAIDPPRGGSLVDWATYFLRYSAYLGYGREQDVPDVAGDNASYKRGALEAHPDLVRNGFWELDLHRRLRAEGRRVTFDPAVRVTQRHSFGFRRFMAQRFEHGRQFGGNRFPGRPLPVRLAAAAAAPLIPAVFLAKIVRRVVRGRRYYGPFLAALPVMLCFLLAWSLGEAVGYLRPRRPAAEPSPSPAPGRFPVCDTTA